MTKERYIANHELLSQLPVFYQPWFLDMYDKNWQLFTLNDEDGVWIFPYFVEKKMGITINRPPALLPYYGPFFVGEPAHKTMRDAVAKQMSIFLKSQSVVYVAPTPENDFSAIESYKFEHFNRVTYTLDLNQTETALFDGMESMRRRNIRKGLRELTIKAADFDAALYQNWANITFEKRNSTQKQTISFFEQYFKKAIQHNSCIAYTAYDANGLALATTLVLYDNNRAYYILGASNPSQKHSAANAVLLWKSILEAKKIGCKIFDFEGSSIDGIATFFSKFGGVKQTYKGWKKSTSTIWNIKQQLMG